MPEAWGSDAGGMGISCRRHRSDYGGRAPQVRHHRISPTHECIPEGMRRNIPSRAKSSPGRVRLVASLVLVASLRGAVAFFGGAGSGGVAPLAPDRRLNTLSVQEWFSLAVWDKAFRAQSARAGHPISNKLQAFVSGIQ